MKASAEQTAKLLSEGKAVLIDIRFPEEYAVWNVQPSVNIPLNELPRRDSMQNCEKFKTEVLEMLKIALK